MTVPQDRRYNIPLWVLATILGFMLSTLGWAALDRLTLEGEKAALKTWLVTIDARMSKLEEKVDKIYEFNYRRSEGE